MNERDELWWVARQLRAQLEWLQEQGLATFPQVAVAAAAPSVGGSPTSPRVEAVNPARAAQGAIAGDPVRPRAVNPARAALAALADEPVRPPAPRVAVAPAAPTRAPEFTPQQFPPAEGPRGAAAVQPARLDTPAAAAREPQQPVSLDERRSAASMSLAPMSLTAIREDLGNCERCQLSKTRKNIVFGVGNPQAELMFVGEGPGQDEDLSGEPFVGPAGKLLTRIIGAMGLSREEVYIANVVKCRPPRNRDPEAGEVAACSPFLFQQIASIQPKIIVALGRPACATLIGAPLTTSISKLRGRFLRYRGEIPLMPTFHPAYVLRMSDASLQGPSEVRRQVWDDMKLVVAELEKLTGKKYELAKRGKDQ